MHGVRLKEVEVQDFWAYMRTVSGIASEILPAEPPSLAPYLALQQEFEFAHFLYQTSRSVESIPNTNLKFRTIMSNDTNKLLLTL